MIMMVIRISSISGNTGTSIGSSSISINGGDGCYSAILCEKYGAIDSGKGHENKMIIVQQNTDL